MFILFILLKLSTYKRREFCLFIAILLQTDRMLSEEKSADDTLRQQFKEKWTRTPSDKLTATFSSNAARYRQIINNAVQADKVVRDKFDTHKHFMELLSAGPSSIEAALPSGTSGNISDTSAVTSLRQLMEEVSLNNNFFVATIELKFLRLRRLRQRGKPSSPS